MQGTGTRADAFATLNDPRRLMSDEDSQQAGATPESGGDDSSQEGATATLTKPKKTPKESDRKPKQPPPYKVILHNDDVNSFDHVIMTILKLTPLELEEAVEKTVEAHEQGLVLLLVSHQERAELYQEQFASAKLIVTIEPDE